MSMTSIFYKATNQILIVSFILICVEKSIAQERPVLEWAKSMGGTGGDNEAATVVDGSGNVYTTGYFTGTSDFDPGAGVFNLTSAGFSDFFVSKLDANGNFIWAKSVGGATTDDEANAISQDNSGNLYITGSYKGTVDFDPGTGISNLTSGSGTTDIFILKLTSDGNFVWARSEKVNSTGTTAAAIVVSGSGDVFATATYQGTGDFDPGAGTFNLTALDAYEAFVVRLDANGNFVWAKSITNGATGRGIPTSIALDNSGNVITAGIFLGTVDLDPGAGVYNLTSPGSNFGVFVSKLAGSGNFVWAGVLVGDVHVRGYGVAIDNQNNVYTTGYFAGTADFDPGTGVFNLFAGSDNSFISKLDSDGNMVWAKVVAAGGGGASSGSSIAVDDLGNVYSMGYFFGTKDFDPGAGIFYGSATSNYDNYISKLDTDGNLVWATSIVSSDGYDGSITLDGSGYFYVSGSFVSTPDFDPGACTFNITPKGANDIFIQKLSIGGTTTITSFDPISGPVGTPITITGTFFSTTPANNVVKFFNNKPATVTASTATSITTTVPVGATTGKISLTLNCATVQSAANFVVGSLPVPTITSFTPTSGAVSTTVTITGTNFSPTPANNTVKFNGSTAVVTASTATSITTTVPNGATTGKITVTVAGITATSVSDFTVTTAVSITVNKQPSDTTVCAGAGAIFKTAASGTTNIGYHWQFASVADPSNFSDLVDGGGYTGATTATLSINTSGSFGAGNYRCKINGDLATTVFTNSASLTINPVPSAATVTGATGCSPSAVTLNASGGSAGNYRWYLLATGGSSIAGETGGSYTTPEIAASTTYFVSVVSGACESTRTSVTATITGSCNPGSQAPDIVTQPLTTLIGGVITLDLVPLITTENNNLDVSSIRITTPPSSGAAATVTNGILTINYGGIAFSGSEKIGIEACDLDEQCTDEEFTIEVSGEIVIYNAVSPGGANPTFVVKNIELLPQTKSNRVAIYDQWQNRVWHGNDYDNNSVIFKGSSDTGGDLPTGTYFYKIEFNSGRKTQTGFLSLKR
jgi:Ig-like domain CHU_C associated/CHU_C Type IX secretion signal domain/IPT/TIG domain